MAVSDIVTSGFGSFSDVKYVPTRGFIASTIDPLVPVFDTNATVWRGRSPYAQDSLYPRRAQASDTRIGRNIERVQ